MVRFYSYMRSTTLVLRVTAICTLPRKPDIMADIRITDVSTVTVGLRDWLLFDLVGALGCFLAARHFANAVVSVIINDYEDDPVPIDSCGTCKVTEDLMDLLVIITNAAAVYLAKNTDAAKLIRSVHRLYSQACQVSIIKESNYCLAYSIEHAHIYMCIQRVLPHIQNTHLKNQHASFTFESL